MLKVSKLYYRLQQVDKDGKAVYSRVVAIPLLATVGHIVVKPYPNPFRNYITLQIMNVSATDKMNRVQIKDLTGKSSL